MLFGLNAIVVPEPLVESDPESAPFGRTPPAPGGVAFTLIVKSSPVIFTPAEVPVVTILPKFIILGVTTPLPEPELYVSVSPPIVTCVVVFCTQPATPLQLRVDPVVL